MKKIRILCSVLAVLMILPSMLLLASCGKKSSLTADTEISSLDLNHSQLTLYIGDTIKLVPIVKGLDNPSLIFTSSHPSIASVENTGTVTALSEGETMIVCQTEDQVLTATCNITVKAKDDSGTNDPVTPSLTLDTTALTLNPGNTHTLTVTLILPETVDQTITFTSSDSSVATVDKNGTITAIAPGVASIMATASNDLQAICLVTVGNDGAQRVNLDFTSATLVVDSTKQLNATYFTTIPGDSKTLTYSSSLPSVASIDNNGLITAKSPGTAVITVSNFNGTTNAICTITVIEKPTAHLTLDFTGITLSIGMSHTLNPTYIPINDSDSKVLSFTSSLPSVASIDQNGTITAKAAGTAQITVSNAKKTVFATCTVTVIESAKAFLTLDVSTLVLTAESSYTLKSTYIPANDFDSKLVYFTSSMPSVATVDENGKITAVSAGTTVIIVTNEDKSASATCNVTVIPKPTASLTLDTTDITLTPNKTYTLKATYVPAYDSDSKKLVYTSSQPTVAHVDQNGTITAKAAGSTVITVSNSDGSAKATCTVTVKENKIILTQTSITLEINQDHTILPIYVPVYESDSKILTYISSNSAVATVDQNGKITANNEGTATITISNDDGSAKATFTVTVIPKPKASLTLDKTTLSLSVGNSITLNPTYVPAHDSDSKVLTYSSSHPSIATVDQNGKITAQTTGTATITVANEDSSVKATCTVTVISKPQSNLTLDKAAITLAVNKTYTLTPTYIPANDSDSMTLNYTSSAPTVATVDENGKITAKSVGTATITVSNHDGSAKATCAVTVKENKLTLEITRITITEGGKYTIEATYTPADPSASKILTYTSNKTNIATVDSSGNITTVAPGSATITVSNEDGSTKAYFTVIVNEKPIASLSLDVTQLTLNEGTTYTLHPSYTPVDASDPGELTFTSTNSAIATVDATGKITAKAAGFANIIVTNKDESLKAICKITVNANSGKEESLTLDITKLSLMVGENKQLKPSYTAANDTDSKILTYISSDPTIATVDATGTIHALAEGSVIITVTNATKSVEATCTVTIKKAPEEVTNIIKSGAFKSDTGTQLNLRVEWMLSQNNLSGKYTLTANVYLESYSISCREKSSSSNYLMIDGQKFNFKTDALNYIGVKEKQKIFFTTASIEYEQDELPETVEISASWRYDGSYSGVKIPVINPQDIVTLK